MAEFLRRVIASIVGRGVFQLLVVPLLGVGMVAALSDSWNYILTAPPGVQFVVFVGVVFVLLWLVVLVHAYLNTSRTPGAAPRKVLWYKLPIRKVRWDLEGYLGYGRFQGGPIVITRFGVRYKVNWGEGIVMRLAFIECKRTGTRFEARTDPGNNFVALAAPIFIPRGRWHSCDVAFDPTISQEDFLTRLDSFWFVCEYDKSKFRRYFSRNELENYLNAGRRNMIPSSEPGAIG